MTSDTPSTGSTAAESARTRWEARYAKSLDQGKVRDIDFTTLSGLEVEGYEIRVGHSALESAATPACVAALPDGLGWQHGPVLALYLHGLFENPSVLQALFGTPTAGWDDRFDRLARQLERRFTRAALMQLL